MSLPTSVRQPLSGTAPANEVPLPDIVGALELLVGSAEPAVVLLSVAQACVPTLCSSVVIAVSEAGERAYTIANPQGPSSPSRLGSADTAEDVVSYGGIRVAADSTVTQLRGAATSDHPAYAGVLVMTFARPAATDAVLGRLVADRAVALVDRERLHDIADRHRTDADNLSIALRSSRDIGIALGIIMNQHRVTETDAFDLLCTTSQHANRKLRDLALEVAQTGQFDLPERTLAPRRALRSGSAANARSFAVEATL